MSSSRTYSLFRREHLIVGGVWYVSVERGVDRPYGVRSLCRLGQSELVLLGVGSVPETVDSTVALEQLVSDPEVIARANDVENTTKLYRAGAEYVLALSTITGRMLSSVLIDEEEVLSPNLQFEVIRTSAPALEGRSLGEADVGDITGATVVAVERDGELLTNIGPEYTARADDTLIVAGSDDAVNKFIRLSK